jgi:prepilin-type N-terminal cleavage/methylation domain-containing protein
MKRRLGFTLIELLVVMAIVAALLGIEGFPASGDAAQSSSALPRPPDRPSVHAAPRAARGHLGRGQQLVEIADTREEPERGDREAERGAQLPGLAFHLRRRLIRRACHHRHRLSTQTSTSTERALPEWLACVTRLAMTASEK